MATFRSVLCAVDFSDHSRHALRWAAAFSAQPGSRLIVVAAVDPLLANAARFRFDLDLRVDTGGMLRDFVASTLPSEYSWLPPTEVQAHVGDAPDVILRTAHDEHADLIVLGTHGLGGIRKLLLGSTSDRVLRDTKTPVLTVPMDGADGVSFEAAGPRFALTTILAATDFSASADRAIDSAATLAADRSATLVLAHVVAPVAVPSQWQSYVEGVEEERVAQARARLGALEAGLAPGIRPHAVVTPGRPAEAIAEIARQQSAGLIVLGQTGDRGDGGPRPGSIAYRVVCLSHVPVLVVPPS